MPVGSPSIPAPTVGGQPGDIELKRIYVFSKYHGTGTGRDLMTRALQHAREVGAKRMLLGTYDQNHRAVAFYKREGYALVGTRQFQVGDRLFDDVIMAKPL